MGSKLMTADGYVTPSNDPGIGGTTRKLYSLLAHGLGITAGDRVVIRDSGPTGTVKAIAVASAVNGDFGFSSHEGIDVVLPIYYSEQKTGGTIYTEVVWK